MPVNKQAELDAFLEENLRKGYIVPSKFLMASPVFFVKKKDGKLRMVQDYRKLNDIIVKNRYPLPLASNIINRLRQSKYFTKFDVRWGYNNIRIKEGDEWKAAFTTNRGLFKPQVMFFGLTNSPATFQALMNSIFGDLIAAEKVAVYLDDILIFSSTREEHCQITHEVLQRLQKHDLFLRPETCEFERTEIEYLGLVIRQGEVVVESPAPPLLGSAYAYQNSAQTPQYPRSTSASASLPSERLAQRLFPSYTIHHSLRHHSHYDYHSTLKNIIGISLATGHVIDGHMLHTQLRYQTCTNRYLVCAHLLQYIGRVDPAPVPHLDLLSHWGQVSTSCTRWSSQYT